jgi:HlyD family secretion protein
MSGARVEQLLVAVGDNVTAGQVVAILDSHRSRTAALYQSRAMIAVSRAKVALIKAGPKREDVKAQEAVIRRLEAELVATEHDYERGKGLIRRNALSREDYDARRSKYEQSRASLEEARAKLEAMQVIRPVDVQGAEAELAQAEAGLVVAQEDVRNTEVRCPISGQVLRIRTRAGERIGDQGILDVGNTRVMQVVAEVYEEDVAKVRLGQQAKVRVPTLGAEFRLSGAVVSKNLVVARQDIFKNDPVADIDSRVVEVRIRLSPEAGALVQGLSNARAEVVIDVSGGSP